MVRSMFAGVAGLRAHQSKMDVIGNNIANVNTWGYKAGSMSFKDAMYQNTSSGSGGNTATGGIGAVNANQIGYGVTTGSITYDFSTGSMAPSASGLDCMIQGTGFFLVGPMVNGGSVPLEGEDAVKSSGLYLSRVGKFKVDPHGYLTDDSGSYVYGFDFNQDTKTFTKGSLVPLKLPNQSVLTKLKGEDNTKAVDSAKAALNKAWDIYNTQYTSLTSARQAYVLAQSNYQSKYDSLGIKKKEEDLAMLKSDSETAYATWKNATTDPGNALRKAYYDKLDAYEDAEYKLIQDKANLRAPVELGKVTNPQDYYTKYHTDLDLVRNTPDTDANYATYVSNLKVSEKAFKDVKSSLSILEDGSLEGLKDAAKLKASTEETLFEGAKNGIKTAQGNLDSAQKTAASTGNSGNSGTSTEDSLAEFSTYKIQEDGTIVGVTSNSDTVTIGKIALGSVQNIGGLEKNSGYYYTVGASAGNVSVFEGGSANVSIKSNFLEMAKVDLATEMTDMITTQRGFQANSKIITVTDQMLEELVNMKR